MAAPKKKFDAKILATAAFIVVVLGGLIGGFAYISVQNKSVYIDKSQIQAPLITLAPKTAGILKNVYVNPGDTVSPNTVVASVGTQLIKTTSGGLIVTVHNDIGKTF